MNLLPNTLLSFVCIFHLMAKVRVDGANASENFPNYIVRKCCAGGEYYNLQSQECLKHTDPKVFGTLVTNRLIKGKRKTMVVVTGRLLKCPDTNECFETGEIINENSHTLLPQGQVLENFFRLTYDLRNYCLETVGDSSQNLTLVIAFCLPETKILPKCCPQNQYFDTKTFDCIKYPKNDESELLLSTFLYFKNEIFLRYQRDLACASAFPIRYNFMNDTYIDECNNICLRNSKKCYSRRKYCLDNALRHRLEPSIYVCADNVTQVCCKDEFYEDNELTCSCVPRNML